MRVGYHTKTGVNSLTAKVSGVALYKLKARFKIKLKNFFNFSAFSESALITLSRRY
jgi:hypothetical protein